MTDPAHDASGPTAAHWIGPTAAANPQFDSTLDERMPFQPGWSWVYSFLHDPAIRYRPPHPPPLHGQATLGAAAYALYTPL